MTSLPDCQQTVERGRPGHAWRLAPPEEAEDLVQAFVEELRAQPFLLDEKTLQLGIDAHGVVRGETRTTASATRRAPFVLLVTGHALEVGAHRPFTSRHVSPGFLRNRLRDFECGADKDRRDLERLDHAHAQGLATPITTKG